MPSTLCPSPETGHARDCTSLPSKSYHLQLLTARMWPIDPTGQAGLCTRSQAAAAHLDDLADLGSRSLQVIVSVKMRNNDQRERSWLLRETFSAFAHPGGYSNHRGFPRRSMTPGT